jgi:hypothetical protein
MADLNCKRIVIGGLLGGLVWNIWSFIINGVLLSGRYENEILGGRLMRESRYPYFLAYWVVLLFLLGMGLAWLYAASRSSLGPGPLSAVKVGLVVGIIGGLPGNLAQMFWAGVSQWMPLGWAADMVGGCVLATLASGWYYRET